MKKYCFTLLILCVSLVGLSQEGLQCAHLKSRTHHLTKERSATLSLEYIELTHQYDVHFYFLDVNLERTSTDISGSTEIHATVIADDMTTFLFELHEDLDISDILLNGTTSVPFSREGSAVLVPVSFSEGDNFFMRILYSGTPPVSGSSGLGGSGMTNSSSPTWGNEVTWSLSEPFLAYEWFPCKQYLNDKADSLYVFVTTDSENKVGSQGLLTDVVDVGGGKSRHEWKSNYPIDYYLISVAVAKYVDYTIYANPAGAAEPIMIQNYIYDNPACLPFFESNIDETVGFMEHFSELFGMYPFEDEKYGHAMVPIGGGMEHQTMTSQGFFSDGLTAHELGHQWFGNNVTCASWADIWINEGFASYSEELMMEEFNPGDEIGSMENRHEDIMSQPDGAVWVEDSLNASRIFNGRLTYNKGAAIVHTMRFLVNDDDLFFQILREFQVDYTDGTARGDDFKEKLEDLSGESYLNFFNEWYYGEGFPTYSGTYNQIGSSVFFELSQSVSAPAITPYFTNDLELRITGEDGTEEIVRLSSIDGATTLHSFTFSEKIVSIEFDPNNWVINQDGSITEDTELVEIPEQGLLAKIYPNPATEFLYIENKGELFDYQIVNSSGKVVLQGQLPSGETTIPLNGLSQGAYFLKYNGGIEKFLKK
ncbi:MAG: T9SS type A sorting domain-containing protein [Flavobacteriales bacterium]|nr:T9SS type A sorting domain-containing protein [Flavobacteriales bacterium]